jgi:hypothetical protein
MIPHKQTRHWKIHVNRRILRRALALFFALVLVAAAVPVVSLVERYWPRHLPFPRPAGLPSSVVVDGRLVIRVPGRHLVGELARYNDELFAYLIFDYLQMQPDFRNTEVLLTYSLRNGSIAYIVKVVLPNDFVSGIPRLYELANQFPFLTPDYSIMDGGVLHEQQLQTETFARAYNFPAYQKLEQLSASDVVAYARRLIRFKSSTDRRILRRIEPAPHPLSQDEAQQLAEDIVAVARFYSLPLEFFLGIGAMENNYMSVDGDVGHAVWKRRADKGDLVLRRRRHKVLVLDESVGVWQITRETLRYAHRLYLKDQRDYSQLPPDLRPPRDLDIGDLNPRVLTTYAGILFRDLLDRFQGDVGKAVGAYNGGPRNPNPGYEEGVRLVAQYARRVLEQAASLRGQRVVNQQFLQPAPSGGK